MVARQPWSIFVAVQKALFLRELGMRFTVSKAGVFWTFFEPFMQVFVMVIVKVVVFGRAGDTFDFAAFLALNFTAYNLFKNILTKAMGSFAANKGLFVYKQVKPIDTIIARTLVEVYISGIIIIVFVMLGAYLGHDLNVQDLPMVALGFVWLVIFSWALGVLVAVGNLFYPSIGRVINVIMIFVMFGSAVFYSISKLPPKIGELLLYNPLTNFLEMIHGYYFVTLDDRYVDYGYMGLWTLSLLAIGLWLYRHLEERIISQ